MKLKIRGLIFTGFAAAVFAQSAMAVTPPTQENPALSADVIDDLKSTVTSKYYTNETFQTRTTVATGETSDTLKVGRGEGQWGVLRTYGAGSDVTTTDGYLDISTDVSSGRAVYELDIKDNKVADNGTEIAGTNDNGSGTGPDASHEHDLTTAKAVYEFVTEQGGNFQRKINGSDPKAQAYVGVYVGETGQEESEWYQYLGGSTTSVDNGNNSNENVTYISIIKDDNYGPNGAGAVVTTLARDKITTTGAQVVAADNTNHDLTDLVTVNALREYTGGNSLPPMDANCEAAGSHCALVTSVVSGEVVLEWRVMAGAETSAGSGDNDNP